MRVIKLSQEELFDLVWATPVTELAKKYKVSVTRIKSACTGKKIPFVGTRVLGKSKVY